MVENRILKVSNYVDNLLFLFKKKKNMDIRKRIFPSSEIRQAVQYSELRIKKSVTNYFITFSAKGKVLFSCSAGSAGKKKKERRRKDAINAMSQAFSKYVRYYVRTHKDYSIFRNIIVFLNARVYRFKLFLRSIKYDMRKLTRRKNKAVIRSNKLISNKYRLLHTQYVKELSSLRDTANSIVHNSSVMQLIKKQLYNNRKAIDKLMCAINSKACISKKVVAFYIKYVKQFSATELLIMLTSFSLNVNVVNMYTLLNSFWLLFKYNSHTYLYSEANKFKKMPLLTQLIWPMLLSNVLRDKEIQIKLPLFFSTSKKAVHTNIAAATITYVCTLLVHNITGMHTSIDKLHFLQFLNSKSMLLWYKKVTVIRRLTQTQLLSIYGKYVNYNTLLNRYVYNKCTLYTTGNVPTYTALTSFCSYYINMYIDLFNAVNVVSLSNTQNIKALYKKNIINWFGYTMPLIHTDNTVLWCYIGIRTIFAFFNYSQCTILHNARKPYICTKIITCILTNIVQHSSCTYSNRLLLFRKCIRDKKRHIMFATVQRVRRLFVACIMLRYFYNYKSLYLQGVIYYFATKIQESNSLVTCFSFFIRFIFSDILLIQFICILHIHILCNNNVANTSFFPLYSFFFFMISANKCSIFFTQVTDIANKIVIDTAHSVNNFSSFCADIMDFKKTIKTGKFFLFRILMYVEKSAVPFNGCRSRTRL
jgi:hypothetical protein